MGGENGDVMANSSRIGSHSDRIVCDVLKDKDQLWSRDCIVEETLWNRSEKVDHLAYKYWCVLQGSGIIKMIRNLAQSCYSYKHCTQKDVYGTNEHVA